MKNNVVEKAFSLVLESNLSALKRDSERRFSLLMLGEVELVSGLARALSLDSTQEGGGDIHPWIRTQLLAHPEEIEQLREVDVVFLVAGHSTLTEAEATALRWLHRAAVPTIVVVVEAAHLAPDAELRTEPPQRFETARVVLPDTYDRHSLQQRLVPALAGAAQSSLRLAIPRQFPVARAPIVDQLIEDTARANAIYAASTVVAEMIPILNLSFNAADILILSKNQLIMAYKIALATGKRGTVKEVMGEIVGVVGGGFLFRQVARQLVGSIPVVGIVPKIAIAYAGTWVIGRSVYLWSTEGKKLDMSEARNFQRAALARGRVVAQDVLRRVVKRRGATDQDAAEAKDDDAPLLALPEPAMPTVEATTFD